MMVYTLTREESLAYQQNTYYRADIECETQCHLRRTQPAELVEVVLSDGTIAFYVLDGELLDL